VAQIAYPAALRREVASLAIRLRLHGHRGDLTIAKAARALAAWEGHEAVTFDDAQAAIDLALPHRYRGPRRGPAMQGILARPEGERGRGQQQSQDDEEPDPFQVLLKQRSATRRIARDREQFERLRLRLPPDRVERERAGRRTPSQTALKRGRYARSRSQELITDLALDATLRAAAPHQRRRGRTQGGRLRLRPADLRQKRREHKTANLFVFVVDSSGSVMDKQRMTATKGAVLTFLESAYQKRDRVALIAFQDARARLVVPPTGSVELAVRALEALEVGGLTPLTHAILEGLRVVKQEQLRDPAVYPLLVFLTDGIGNVTLEKRANSTDEARRAADVVRSEGIPAIVIDPGGAFNPEQWRGLWSEAKIEAAVEQLRKICPDLAHAMGARYYPIAALRRGAVLQVARPRRLR
jgi:magnesium chelatase subunit D